MVKTTGLATMEISTEAATPGTAVFNQVGEVVAVVTNFGDSTAIAVPGKSVQEMVSYAGLSLGGSAVEAAGVTLRGNTTLIQSVDASSDAHSKGLRPGQLVLEIGGSSISTGDEFVKGVDAARALGRRAVLLRIQDGGETRFVAVQFAK